MSTLVTNNIQLGSSGTPTNNFTIYQPTTPDGTVRIGSGNTGTTSSLVTLTSTGNLGIGTSSPGFRLQVNSPEVYQATFNGVGAAAGGGIRTLNSGGSAGVALLTYGPSYSGGSVAAVGPNGSIVVQTGNAPMFVGTDVGISQPLYLGTGGTECARITSDGNLLLGTTNTTGRLTVNLPATTAAAIATFSNSTKSTTLTVGVASLGNDYLAGTVDGDFIIRSENSNLGIGVINNTKNIIFGSATTERARLDTAGRFTVPGQPAFYAGADLYNPSLLSFLAEYVFKNSTTSNRLSTPINVGNHFSPTTGRFTAPVAGTYYFSGAFSRSIGNGITSISKNGVPVAGARVLSYGTDWQTGTTTAIISLAVNDYVELNFGGVNGTTTSGYSIHFCGYLIG